MFDDITGAVNDRLPEPVKVGLGTVYVRTERGKGAIDSIASLDWWDTWHNAGVVALFASMVAIVVALAATAARNLLADVQPSAANEPTNLVAIPAVNDFIPIEASLYMFLALAAAATVHELAHAIAMRREGVEIQEMGVILLLGVLPLGAYVLPDEELGESTAAFGRLRIYSAGVMANLALVVLASVPFLLGAVDPLLQAWAVYFGGITSGMERVAFESVGAVTHLAFWMFFINLNLALVNALPVTGLDGGQVGGVVSSEWLNRECVVTRGAAVLSTVLFVLAIFGPHL